MTRCNTVLCLATLCGVLGAGSLFAQTRPVTIKPVNRDDVKAMSGEKGTVVIGSLSSKGHGHVVVVKPDSDRIWDGNILGGFKDLTEGKTIANQNTLRSLNRVINKGDPKGTLDISKASAAEIREYVSQYEKEGGKISWSYNPTDRQKVQWFQVPTEIDIGNAIQNYAPPVSTSASDQNLRCNDLVKTIAPNIKQLVMDDKAADPGIKGSANHIDSVLSTQAKAYTTQLETKIQAPPEPPQTPIYSGETRELKVVPKPGGVIVHPIARIEGLDASEISKCELDGANRKLVFHLKSGANVSADIDPDFVIVAARTIAKGVDPTLSMETSDEVRGYHAVHYTGPLFKTRLGKALFDADDLLGGIIFGYEGPHRSIVADAIPGYRRLSCEAHFSMNVGSRVFLRATGADFQVEDGELVCSKLHMTVDVEGLGDAAAYYQESLHRLAREVDRHFPALVESFDQFRDLQQVAQAVALVKWIKLRGIAFDWENVQKLTTTEAEVPAFAPTSDWSCLFNGETLDGWNINLRSDEMQYLSEDGKLTLAPTGDRLLTVLMPNWRSSFDLRFTLTTSGPIELILKQDDETIRASARLDSLGKPKVLRAFVDDGAWTVALEGDSQKGQVRKGDQIRTVKQSYSGFRIPAGSSLTIYGASMRSR